jgi:predicted nucleotidyltransferase
MVIKRKRLSLLIKIGALSPKNVPKHSKFNQLLNFENTRLDATQQAALMQSVQDKTEIKSVYLFGSRTHIAAKGGDVDIIIIADVCTKQAFDLSLQVATQYTTYCDEKIDVLVLPPTDKMSQNQLDFYNFVNKICIAQY